MESFKYLGVNFTQDLTWSHHINTLVKKTRHRLYHLRCWRDFTLALNVLRNLYTCTFESVLVGGIITWMRSSTQWNLLALRRVVRSAERAIRTTFPNLQGSYHKQCRIKAQSGIGTQHISLRDILSIIMHVIIKTFELWYDSDMN